MAAIGEAVQFTFVATYTTNIRNDTTTLTAPATTITFTVANGAPTDTTTVITIPDGPALATVVAPLSKLSLVSSDMTVQSVEVRAPSDATDSASVTSLISTTDSSVGVTASVTTTSSTATSQSATASSPDVVVSRPGLSDGAKAGIGVGAAVGCILLAGLIGYLLLRMKRQLISRADTEHNPPMKAELPGDGVEKPKPQFDVLGGEELHEAGGLHKPPEMDHMNVRVELEGDWHGHEAATEQPKANSGANR